MVIETAKIQELNNVLAQFIERGAQNTESFLIVPETNYLYFHTSMLKGRVQIPITSEEGDPAQFFVEAQKFLHMAGRYDHIHVSSDFVFSHGKDTFKFSCFQDDRLAEQVQEDDYWMHSCRDNELIYDDAFLSYLKKANRFIEKKNPRPEHRGAFLNNGRLYVVNNALIFEAQTDKTSVDHALTKDMVNIILGLGEDTCVQKCEKPYRIVNANYQIEIILPPENTLAGPDISAEKFVNAYNHANKIMFEREDVLQSIKFLERYASDSSQDDGVRLRIDDDTLVVESREDELFKKVLPLDYASSELDGVSFLVSSSKFEKALTTVESEHVTVQVDAIGPLLRIIGTEDESYHVILAKIKE